jgi:hypothetical protein
MNARHSPPNVAHALSGTGAAAVDSAAPCRRSIDVAVAIAQFRAKLRTIQRYASSVSSGLSGGT